MLTPSKLDPNYKAEMERKNKDPASFGMGIPLPDPKRDLSGSGLTADRDKDKAVVAPALTEEEVAAGAAAEEASAKLIEFLDQSIHDIVPQIEDMDDEQLATLHAAETAGRSRKGLLEAIEEEQLIRTE